MYLVVRKGPAGIAGPRRRLNDYGGLVTARRRAVRQSIGSISLETSRLVQQRTPLYDFDIYFAYGNNCENLIERKKSREFSKKNFKDLSFFNIQRGMFN